MAETTETTQEANGHEFDDRLTKTQAVSWLMTFGFFMLLAFVLLAPKPMNPNDVKILSQTPLYHVTRTGSTVIIEVEPEITHVHVVAEEDTKITGERLAPISQNSETELE